MTVCKKQISENLTLATLKWRDLREALSVIGVDLPDNTRVDVSRFGTPQCHQFYVESDEDTIGFTYAHGDDGVDQGPVGVDPERDVPDSMG